MIKAAVAPVARVLLACGVVLCGLRFAAHSEQAAEPLAVSEAAAGVFMHTGALALMTRANGGGIANIGFVVGNAASSTSEAVTTSRPALGEPACCFLEKPNIS